MNDLTSYYLIDQILFLQKLIKDYQSHLINFHDLIKKIETLLDRLEDYKGEWKELLKSLWFELEVKYSIVLDENRLELTMQETQQINEIIEKIYQLTEQHMRDIPENYWCQKL